MNSLGKLTRSALIFCVICQSQWRMVKADEGSTEIQKAVELLNAGKIDEAREIISRAQPEDSLEVRYLAARLQAASNGEPAPDLIQTVPVPEGVEVRYAVLNPAKRQAVFICRDGGLRVADLSKTSAELKVVKDPEASPVFRGRFTGDGQLFFSGHQSGNMLIWKTEDWTLQTTVAVNSDWPIRELDVAVDGQTFVAESKDGLHLWSIRDDAPTKVAKLADRLNFGEGLSISPKGDLIATGGMFDINIHDAVTGETKGSMRHASYTMGLQFSPDGLRIASAPRGNVNKFLAVFDVADSKELFNIGPFGSYVAGLAFTPDGTRLVATGCEKQVRIVDAQTGEIRLTIPRQDCSSEPAVSKDGSLFGWSEPTGFMFVDLSAGTITAQYEFRRCSELSSRRATDLWNDALAMVTVRQGMR